MEDKREITKIFGNRLKERRLELGLSATDLANLIDTDRSTIYRYEQGNNKGIRLASIEALAKALSVNPDWLIGKSNDKEIVTCCEINPVNVAISVDEIFNYVKYQLYYNENVTLLDKPITEETAKTILQALRVGIEIAKEDLNEM